MSNLLAWTGTVELHSVWAINLLPPSSFLNLKGLDFFVEEKKEFAGGTGVQSYLNTLGDHMDIFILCVPCCSQILLRNGTGDGIVL